MHALRLEVELERLEPELAAEAGLLVAAERDAREGGVRHVDPDRARLDPAREPVAARGIARPDRRHQPVLDVVRDPDRVLLVLERDHRHDRAEDLLLRDRRSRCSTPREHGRRVERAAPSRLAAGHDLGALARAPPSTNAVHPLAVRRARSASPSASRRRAGRRPSRACAFSANCGDDVVVDRLLDEDARARLAALAGRVVDRPDRARDRVERGRRRRRRGSGSCRRARASRA